MKSLPVTHIRIHVAAWSAYIAYEVIAGLAFNQWQFASFWDYSLHYVLYISFFYFNAHVALPSTINQEKKRYFLYSLWLIAELLVYMLMKYLILYAFIRFNIPLTPVFTTNIIFISVSIGRITGFLGFSVAYWFALTTIENRKKISELENLHIKDKIATEALETAIVRAENAYLKSQINPQFLFNTLDFLHNSVSKFSNKIADSFMSLSEIMRYALAETTIDGKVPLASEVVNINNFIKLNQDRFSDRLQIVFEVEGDVTGALIVPLILMTIVENVFKYGDLLNPVSPAKIILTNYNDRISFLTENMKKKSAHFTSHGIGLQNLKKRLAVCNTYKLDIDENGETYKSVLQIWK